MIDMKKFEDISGEAYAMIINNSNEAQFDTDLFTLSVAKFNNFL